MKSSWVISHVRTAVQFNVSTLMIKAEIVSKTLDYNTILTRLIA
jgi:hypothetical protein